MPTTRSLEERIQAIEDRLEIYNLIASHPPSADTGGSDAYLGELGGGRRVRPRRKPLEPARTRQHC